VTTARSRWPLLLSLLATVAAAGCSRGAPSKAAVATAPAPASSPGAPLPADLEKRRARLVEIATAFAVERGMTRESIQATSVKEANAHARVFFQSEPRRPGSHFTVVVDTTAGTATELIPGR
jgi:hypothetical protein